MSSATRLSNPTGWRVGAHAAALTTLALTAAATLAGCGGGAADPYGGGPTTPPASAPGTVNATAALAFTPASLTVKAGDTVTFAFGSVAHNVYFDATPGAPADIEGQNAAVSVRRAFPAAGTYRYVCHIHPFMNGTVVVQAPGAAAGPGGY